MPRAVRTVPEYEWSKIYRRNPILLYKALVVISKHPIRNSKGTRAVWAEFVFWGLGLFGLRVPGEPNMKHLLTHGFVSLFRGH